MVILPGLITVMMHYSAAITRFARIDKAATAKPERIATCMIYYMGDGTSKKRRKA